MQTHWVSFNHWVSTIPLTHQTGHRILCEQDGTVHLHAIAPTLVYDKARVTLIAGYQKFMVLPWIVSTNSKFMCFAMEYMIYVVNTLINWKSTSMEIEFRSITDIATEIDWLILVFAELGISITSTIWCENLDATHSANNLKFHMKIKHMGLDFNFIWEYVE